MTIPVLWVSRHPDTIMARKYADQGMLEAMLDRSLWRPPGALELEHHEVLGDDWPDVDGAVVILPARHHASPEDVEWFRAHLDALSWSLVVLAGDEEWVFPWREIPESERRRVWVMQPRPEHEGLGLLPGGWSPGTRESFARYKAEADERPLDWFFAGQVTHERRERCVRVLRTLDNGGLVETKGYMQGIDLEDYRRGVASAKVLPCPSGPYTVDTNRPLEAMESGGVPVCDTVSPHGPAFDYWRLVFGAHPLPTVMHWREFKVEMRKAVAQWPASSNRVFQWWQQWKRSICLEFERDLQRVSGIEPDKTAEDLITVIVATSPIESHPDTTIIEKTVASIRERLPRAEVVIVCDGVRDEQEHLRAGYEEYLRRLLWLCNFEWRNVVPLRLETWGHQANALRAALTLVETPQILFIEHDTPLVNDIDFEGLTAFIGTGRAEAVRFHHESEVLPDHEHLMLDPKPVWEETERGSVPVLRTNAWWQRPHLASTSFYRKILETYFTAESRTMIEDRMYGIVRVAWLDFGLAGWDRFRLYIYAPEGTMQRSDHLNGRGDAPKFEMKFE